jgi:uncharacterized membrane protein YphA (DoxX/SURF4 family)
VISHKVEGVYQLLRASLGVMALAAGLDKFANMLARWDGYLAPPIAERLGGTGWFMAVVGIVEVLVGVAILTGATRTFGYLLCGWLVAIACNLVIGGYYDIAVRDLMIAAAAFSLAQLARARAEPMATVQIVPERELQRV